MDHIGRQKRKTHPKETANLLSELTFFYTLGLFRKGFKKDLEEDDLYEVLSDYKSKDLGDQLEREWELQKTKRKTRSIFRLLWTCYGWRYLMLGFVQLIIKTAIILLQPHALGKLVSYFEPGQTLLTHTDAIYYAALVIGLNLVSCVYIHNYHIAMTGLGIQIRTAFCSFIYRKTLKLSPAHLGDISIGKIVTLITKDVLSFEAFVMFANDLWIGIIKTAIICYLIYNKIGVAALAGVGFFFVILPLQIFIGKWATSLRMKMCHKTDERLQITQETLSAIRMIKMYTWEKVFGDQISDARRSEIHTMHKTFYLKFIILIIGTLNSKIAFYLLIMTYMWLGNIITAEIVYYILSCFNILTHTLGIMFPIAVSQTAELYASVKRIGNVVKALEIDPIEQITESVIKPKVILNGVTVEIKDKTILDNVSLNIDLGLTLITGPVGSGKSFLLKTILQDYPLTSGKLITHGRISYSSQEPWLFPSSIRQNILFGEKFDEVRYQEVLRVCALNYDFELLANGDNTIVEDRGINLSKGQQARINLARAVYKDSDIYLLDDCLSALDAHVSDYIFTECIKKFLGNKLVVLVTHNTNHLSEMDNIAILSGGKVKSFVKPSDITENILNDIEEKIDNKELKENDELNDENEANEETKLITETATEKKVYQEPKEVGDVSYDVYKKYIKFGGGYLIIFLVFVVFASAQFAISYTDKLVSIWVNLEKNISNYSLNNHTLLSNGVNLGKNFSNYSMFNDSDSSDYENIVSQRDYTLLLYTSMTLAATVLTLARSFAVLLFAKRASLKLHKYMISNIINAAMEFFDTNFIGNILNRFSKDLTTIDEQLPFVFYHFFRVLLVLVGIITLIASVNITFLIPTGIFFVILAIIRFCYIPTGRSLKRLDAITRSPVVGHLNATLEGLTTIRAFKAENILRDEFDRHQDLYTSASYTFQCSMRAFAFFLDTLCTCFIASIVSRFLISDNGTLAGNVGLALSQAFMLTGQLQWGIRQWAEIENQMTSVERALQYTKVKQENKTGQIIEDWPKQGEVVYKNVYLSYTNSTETVLRNINFYVLPKQKIGIVGRTGAGKSSIISTLFRLYEVEGKITIDGVDTRTLSLDFLRDKVSIIPQDPVLFTGTIRTNIDPIGKYSDNEIWQAIEAAKLKSLVDNLDLPIRESDGNFSVGQRQLICLARAIIRKNKIIVLDEATANMDPATDALINSAIERNFANCTVFTIAHKLHSVLKADKVMVLDKGEIIEFDSPANLLENVGGNFYNMVKKAKLLKKE